MFEPSPLSLPRLQKMTEGWLRSRRTMRVVRSTYCPRQDAWFEMPLRLPVPPCVQL